MNDWVRANIRNYEDSHEFRKLSQTINKLGLAGIYVDYIESDQYEDDEYYYTMFYLEVWVIDKYGKTVIDETYDI